MTCIVGVVENGTVYIGGDSAGVGGYDLSVRADRKVFAKDGYVMGFTSSFRMGQLLCYSLNIPKRHPDTDLMKFMVVDFVNAVRNCLKSGGFASKEKDAEVGGFFIVGTQGRLFCIQSDYQVSETVDGFYAVGCGDNFAIGALHATEGMPAHNRVLKALTIAEKCSAGVRGPFHVEQA